jgi:hypothetical protein
MALSRSFPIFPDGRITDHDQASKIPYTDPVSHQRLRRPRLAFAISQSVLKVINWIHTNHSLTYKQQTHAGALLSEPRQPREERHVRPR